MAIYEFRLPDIGEGIAEAELVAWHVRPGDWVDEDAPLADLMTDKATVEMSSPVAGRLVSVAGEVGEQIAVGSVLATFETDSETAGDPKTGEIPAAPAAPPSAVPPPADPIPREVAPERRRILASPTVRARARDLGIDLAEVGSARGERIRHSDLDAFLTYNRARGFGPAGTQRQDEEVRIIGLRRRIAEAMSASKRHIPHFTYVEEIDVTRLEELRADLNGERGDKPKLTLLPLLIAAICRALPGFPMINARYDDEAGIVRRSGAVHLGIATQTDAGLMVPVIRDAQARNIWQLAGEIARLADAARAGKAASQELSGSTLTVSSLGALGGIASTPVINRPEVAIIAPNRVVERPVVRDGAIAVAQLMNLSISCDHRVVDGWDAASFVQAVKRLLETPALLFTPD